MTLPRIVSAVLACLLCAAAHAEDRLVSLTTRGEQKVSYFWMPKDGATATVLLFSGGNGSIGYVDGKPTSRNFLVRSREAFRTENFNVALMGNPTDKRQLDDIWRTSAAHLTDVSNVIDSINEQSKLPLWIVGTSRGTVSAAAIGIGLQQKLAGIVLTSSITAFKQPGAVPRQDIDTIKLPVLVYHHKNDSCYVTVPQDTDWIMRGLKNAAIKKQMIVTGGENPTGDPCEALHWHGFIGMEEQAVKDIAGWIRQPQP